MIPMQGQKFGVYIRETELYLILKFNKAVLTYGYSKNNYGKEVTKQIDTWLDAIRNLRNVCAHYNKLIGKTSSIVLPIFGEEDILVTNTDLFSRIYALKKILNDNCFIEKNWRLQMNFGGWSTWSIITLIICIAAALGLFNKKRNKLLRLNF